MLLVPWLAAVTLSLADSSAADLRSLPDRHSTALDLSTTPSAVLDIRSKRSVLDLTYRPRFGWANVTQERAFVLFHMAGIGYSWGTRHLRLSLSIGGSYGRVSYMNAVVATTPLGGGVDTTGTGDQGSMASAPRQSIPSQILPQLSIMDVGSGSVSLNVTDAFSRRWLLSLGSGFGAGGGLGASEASMPFRYGPFASASLAYQWSMRDTLTSSLSAALDVLPKRHSRFHTVTLMETWIHGFGPLTRSTLGAGATFVHSNTRVPGMLVMSVDDPTILTPTAPTRDRSSTLNAAGLASLWQGFKLGGGAQLGLTSGGTLATTYNPVLGTVAQTLSGSLLAAWTRKRLAINAGVQTSHSLPLRDPNGFSSYGATGGTTYQVSQAVSLSAGVYWTHQVIKQTAIPTTIDPNRWGANLGVTVAAPPMKL